MTLENQDIIQVNKSKRCYPLIFVGAVNAVGSISNLSVWSFAGSFPRSSTDLAKFKGLLIKIKVIKGFSAKLKVLKLHGL